MSGIYLGLGSNLGNRQANMAMALRMLEPIVRVESVSGLYESPPQPPAPPPSYLNAACRVVTGLTPLLLLRHLKRIEAAIGRHDSEHWAPRPIDIDIVFYNDEVTVTDELVIPHPRLLERAFVLRPLLDIQPDLVHPATGEPLVELARRVGDDGLRQISAAGWLISRTPV
jgi:2-amino-4-hydroxy-6-hydroxymethyldihydropteridine diphosphokinase